MAKTTPTEKLFELCDRLPDCCEPFLLETGTEMALSTRVAYARELLWFFEYLTSYCPLFCDKNVKDLMIDDLKQITSQDISRYLTIYLDRNHKEHTVARKRATLSRFFNYMISNKRLEFNPVSAATKVKVHQSDEVIHLTINEQVSFLADVDSGAELTKTQQTYHDRYRLRDTALITMLLDTGMRVSELCGIDIRDLDMDQASVLVTRKGGNLQTLYFSDETRDIVNEYIDSRRTKMPVLPTDPLFVSLKGTRLSIRSVEKLVKKYAISSLPGKDHISPHKMRSSFAMAYYEETRDILALQRKLGHKNLSTTNIYAKATEKKMQETRSVLGDLRDRVRENKNDDYFSKNSTLPSSM